MEYLVKLLSIYAILVILCLMCLLLSAFIGVFSPKLARSIIKGLDLLLNTITFGLWKKKPIEFKTKEAARRELFDNIPIARNQAEHSRLIGLTFVSDHQVWFEKTGTLSVHIRSRDERKSVILHFDRKGVYDVEIKWWA